ncbi:MAG: hypothetical protein Q8P02_01755 [Candidatus Micrarchaeota archaeon]|nr:hypothetical protein [Candidatus Micrarchaeota archaeon]
MQKDMDVVSRRLLVDYGVNLDGLKDLGEFVHSIQEFVQYLGTNQYYSDTVNKKIFLLTLDVDATLLRLGRLHLLAGGFRDALLAAQLSRKKGVHLDEKALNDFHAALDAAYSDAQTLSNRALALTDDIRSDYAKKL